MLNLLQLIGIFVANLFKPRRQLEIATFFSVISSMFACGGCRTVWGWVRVTGRR
jgi:hypothetical protein